MIKLAALATVVAVFISMGGSVLAAEGCLKCHAKTTPKVVGHWKKSAHYAARVGCEGCHGKSASMSHKGKARVGPEKCGSCHREAYDSYLMSRHSTAPETSPECKEKQLAQGACPPCSKDGSCLRVKPGCDSCHTRHGTDAAIAGSAETCGVCHTGPGRGQYEMWRASRHGVLFGRAGKKAAPTCATCHMGGGSHNVGSGIAVERPADVRTRERKAMLNICSGCHAPGFSKRSLAEADGIQNHGRAMLAEAEEIVEGLYSEGLLEKWPVHPLTGYDTAIRPHAPSGEISGPEAMFFRMTFYYMNAFKGAFHQSPEYSRLSGAVPLEMALYEIKGHAALLRKVEGLKRRLSGLDPARLEDGIGRLKDLLRQLRERKLKGEITEGEYAKQKKKLLDDWGL